MNTHSSWDSWLAGGAAKFCGAKVVRTRHLSGRIRPGYNSRLLYGSIPNRVVTTCEKAAEAIREQANLTKETCLSIPTGVDPKRATITQDDRNNFRKKYNIAPETFVIGTACILRSWKD